MAIRILLELHKTLKLLLNFWVGRMPILTPDIRLLHCHIKTYYLWLTLTYISYIAIIECLNWYFEHHSVGMTIVTQWWLKMIQTVAQLFTASQYMHENVIWIHMLHVYSPWLDEDWMKNKINNKEKHEQACKPLQIVQCLNGDDMKT